ncbi:MAG: hypothetical protein FWG66_02655 [Spirochaetes bacterium]|nr:hypothetical protein [Spirochaetota bacterium]
MADLRCPLALEYVIEKYNPDIETPEAFPILIYCALELFERFHSEDVSLHITTPCASLKNLGNSLGLRNVTFMTWNEFAAENAISLKRKTLKESPIPPGFFNGVSCNVKSLASKEEIDAFFSAQKENPDIVELLYCRQGCHNGDGILEGAP